MITLLSDDALRAARALAGLSQREAADAASLTQKAIWMAEGDAALGTSTNIKLRAFYENLGIEFLGTVDLATGLTTGLGVRWRSPSHLPALTSTSSDFHTEQTGVAYGSARAILNKKQSDIAGYTGLSQRKIGLLETGRWVDQASSLRLRSYYERQGIAFLGWGDVSSGLFYGVGVTWK